MQQAKIYTHLVDGCLVTNLNLQDQSQDCLTQAVPECIQKPLDLRAIAGVSWLDNPNLSLHLNSAADTSSSLLLNLEHDYIVCWPKLHFSTKINRVEVIAAQASARNLLLGIISDSTGLGKDSANRILSFGVMFN